MVPKEGELMVINDQFARAIKERDHGFAPKGTGSASSDRKGTGSASPDP
jgi:hypothetical protein